MKIKTILSLFVIAIAAVLLPSCATDPATGKQTLSPQAQAVVDKVTPIATAALTDYLASGGHLSSAQTTNLALQSISDLAPTVTSNQQLQNLIVNTAVAFAGDPKFKQPALDIAKAIVSTLPANPSPAQIQNAVINGGVASSNATQTVAASQ